MRLTSSLSVWLTASDSMLKSRARMRLATRLRTPGRFWTTATRTCRRCSPDPGDRAARRGDATAGGRCVAAHSASSRSSMRSDRPLPAGIIGKTFCSLGDLEPDERRAVHGVGGAHGRVDLLRAWWPSRPGSRRRRRA